MHRFARLALEPALTFGLVMALGTCAAAAFLPPALEPAPPFPLVLSQSLEREFVAPGVERAAYRLQTSAGPLVVSLVAVDPHEPSIRLGAVLARDHIVSTGETVSSMAARTGAVAGINADYFDIGNTNSPLGILAQGGNLVRTPSSRPALTIGRDRRLHITTFAFSGTAVDNGTTTIPLAGVNEWPHEGAAFLTPAYGVPPPATNDVIAELTPLTAPGDAAPGTRARFRVTQVDTGTAPAQPTYALVLGPAAREALAVLPDVGDLIDISTTTTPPLDDVVDALGGGPALLADGVAVDDPLSPGYADRARRIPIAAAALDREGNLLLLVVDGRHPAISIGVDRAELIALLASLGAVNALQFDSGGSATLVARVLGDERASLQNDPSDGVERPVADGLFVYSDAPVGPPARLVVRPSAIEALPDTTIPLRSSVVDAAGHPMGPAHGPWQIDGSGVTIDTDDVLHTSNTPTEATITLARDGVRATLPLEIVPRVSRITIVPERPDVDPNTTLDLHALAFDERGRRVETGDHVRWNALRGSVTAAGTFTAERTDGFVTASLGDVKSSEIVHVGRHRGDLPGFEPSSQGLWRFSSVPAGGSGTLAFTPQGTLQLSYDFRGTERAAYANSPGTVLGDPLALSCVIDGDGGGAGVRIALLDRYGERSALTLAKVIDWTGAQRRDVRVPTALAPPIALQSIYVVGSLAPTPVKTAGTVGIRSCEMTLPGTPPPTP